MIRINDNAIKKVDDINLNNFYVVADFDVVLKENEGFDKISKILKLK